MKYVYALAAVFIFGCLSGGYIVHRLRPGPSVRTVAGPTVTKVQTVTKEVVKQTDGTVIERVVTQTKDRVKASPQPPKPDYRAGALIPVGSERLPTVSGSKRLFGDVWLDAQYDLRHKEVTVGISYEF